MDKKQKTKKQGRPAEPQATYICLNCLMPFRASVYKWYANYCSSACKQKAYRKNHRQIKREAGSKAAPNLIQLQFENYDVALETS